MTKGSKIKFHRGYGDLPAVACPICGFEYVHIESVEVLQDAFRVHVTKDGPRCDEVAGGSGRGSCVAVVMFCEGGHRFSHAYRFHKGFTTLYATDEGVKKDSDELWRD